MNIAVAEIGCQVREPALRIDAFPIPGHHAVRHKGVPKAVESRTASVAILIYTSPANHIAHKLPGGDNTVSAALMHEDSGFRVRRPSRLAAGIKVLAESGRRAGGDRQPARLEKLCTAYFDSVLVPVHVLEFQADDLAQTQPRAVCEYEHRI